MVISIVLPFDALVPKLTGGGDADVAHDVVGEDRVLEVSHVGQEAGSHGHFKCNLHNGSVKASGFNCLTFYFTFEVSLYIVK